MIQYASGHRTPKLLMRPMCDSVTDIFCRLLPTMIRQAILGQRSAVLLADVCFDLLRFYELKVKCLSLSYKQATSKTTI